MSYPINYPTPQGANVQIFSEPGATSDWVKPQGASFVWFTLIGGGGGGGGGDGSTIAGGGGGSGPVTNCLIPAFLIPDVLTVAVGRGGGGGISATSFNGNPGTDTVVRYVQKDTSGYILLRANGGNGGDAGGGTGGTGGIATTSNYFSAAGFFQSVAGQNGANAGANISASATTFLAGGAANTSSTGNYGYSTARQGYFQMQPIIVGVGGCFSLGRGGVGCGGAGCDAIGTSVNGGNGGDGLVVIISW